MLSDVVPAITGTIGTHAGIHVDVPRRTAISLLINDDGLLTSLQRDRADVVSILRGNGFMTGPIPCIPCRAHGGISHLDLCPQRTILQHLDGGRRGRKIAGARLAVYSSSDQGSAWSTKSDRCTNSWDRCRSTSRRDDGCPGLGQELELGHKPSPTLGQDPVSATSMQASPTAIVLGVRTATKPLSIS